MLTAASLFSGPGGLELGATRAGFTLVAGVESDPHAAATVRANIEGLRERLIETDLLSVPSADLRDAHGELDVLLATPPSGAISKAGYWQDSTRSRDQVNLVFDAFLRCLRDLSPRYFVLVTVPALRYRQPRSQLLFARLRQGVADAGYRCEWRVLNAADYGVPQRRERLVMIGSIANATPADFPAATHADPTRRSFGNEMLPDHVSARAALLGLPDESEQGEIVEGRWGHLLPAIPAGGNYQYFSESGPGSSPIFRRRSRYWSFLLKMDPDRPAPTIPSRPGPYTGPFHWESRRLRVAETKRLFTFPDDYAFQGGRGAVQRQLGESVPPLLGESIMQAVAKASGR